MKQKLTALLLVAALISGVAATALATETKTEGEMTTTLTVVEPAETEPAADPAGEAAATPEGSPADTSPALPPLEVPDLTLTQPTGELLHFKDLSGLVTKNNLSYKSIASTIDCMDDLEDMADDLNSSIAYQQTLLAALSPETPNYDGVKDEMKEQLSQTQQALSSISAMIQDTTQMEGGQEQIIFGAETLFITLVGLEQQAASLTRQLAALDRTKAEMELREDMGQISPLTLMEVESGRASLASGLVTLNMNLSNYKMQLAQLLGKDMTESFRLGALPTVTEDQLNALRLEEDLKMVLRRSHDVQAAKISMDDIYDMADQMGPTSSAFSGMHSAAEFTYQDAQQTAELKFRQLYARVQDCRQVLAAAETALTVEEASYKAQSLKYRQGAISQNTLLTAEDELYTAQAAVQTAKNDLFSAYNQYRWAVDRGVLG